MTNFLLQDAFDFLKNEKSTSSDYAFNINELRENLMNTRLSESTLINIINTMKKGKDMSQLCKDVLKLMNTSDYRKKLLCMAYLQECIGSRPGCQLLCTHIFLNDINSKVIKIQELAINYSIKLSDNIIVKNYLYDIKMMSMHRSKRIRMAIADNLGHLYLKSKKLFIEQNMFNILRKLIEDDEIEVNIKALNTSLLIQSKNNFLSFNDIVKLIKKDGIKSVECLKTLLGILKYTKIECDTNSEFNFGEIKKYHTYTKFSKSKIKINNISNENLIKNNKIENSNSIDSESNKKSINNEMKAEYSEIPNNGYNKKMNNSKYSKHIYDEFNNVINNEKLENSNCSDDLNISGYEKYSCEDLNNYDDNEKLVNSQNYIFKDNFFIEKRLDKKMISENKKIFLIELVSLLRRLIKHSDISVFYLASQKLLELDISYAKDVFDQACSFIDLRNEQMYNLLKYVHWLGIFVDFNPMIFAINYNDPDYIKTEKIKIYLSKMKNVSKANLLQQIIKCNDKCTTFYLCIEHNVVFDELLLNFDINTFINICKKLIEINDIKNKWINVIRKFIENNIILSKNNVLSINHENSCQSILKLKDKNNTNYQDNKNNITYQDDKNNKNNQEHDNNTAYQVNAYNGNYQIDKNSTNYKSQKKNNFNLDIIPNKLYEKEPNIEFDSNELDEVDYILDNNIIILINFASEVVDKIPDWIYNVDFKKYYIILIDFYCKMLKRKKITEIECVDYLKEIQSKLPYIRRIEIIIQNLHKYEVEMIFKTSYSKENDQNEFSDVLLNSENKYMSKCPFKYNN